MRLDKLKISNFRSFGHDEVTIDFDKITTFIGSNSTGKTSAIEALNCLFSENKSNRILNRKDFHIGVNEKPDEVNKIDMYIEALFIFDELTEDNEINCSSIPIFFRNMVVDEEGGIPYLRVRLEATWSKSNNIDGAIESAIYYITTPEGKPITENVKCLAKRQELDQIRVIYVPAIRNPEIQLRNVSGTMMHQLISNIKWDDLILTSIKSKIDELNNEIMSEPGISTISKVITSQWHKYGHNRHYSEAHLKFTSTELNSALKSSEVVFSPKEMGNAYSIKDMGDGLRSLFYISMVSSILEVESEILKCLGAKELENQFLFLPPTLTIVAIEEPENHIAPHLMGQLIRNLLDISAKENSQVILTSHSVSIIKRVDPNNIRYFRLHELSNVTDVRNINLPEKEPSSEQFKYIKEAVKAYPELYFAKLVILGEGDSEELLLSKLWNINDGFYTDICGVSIVPLGGRFVHHFWRLLDNLKIPYITLLDLDKERKDGGWGRIKYIIDELKLYGSITDEILNKKLDNNSIKYYERCDESAINEQKQFLDFLESYKVFFSYPLDLDFLMLEAFPEYYKSLVRDSEGPIIKTDNGQKKVKDYESIQNYSADEYKQRVEKAVHNTLKGNGSDGSTYSIEQKRLMIWYTYLFLNRGKPTTHLQFLSNITDDKLVSNLPKVLERLLEKAKKILE